MGRPASAIQIDASRWPLVVTRPPAQDVTDAELEDFLARYAALLGSHAGGFHVDVLDLRGQVAMSAKQRQRLNSWTNVEMPKLGCACIGNALIFSSPLLRGMLTAMLWMRPTQAYPTRVFAELDDAVRWGEGLLARMQSATVSPAP